MVSRLTNLKVPTNTIHPSGAPAPVVPLSPLHPLILGFLVCLLMMFVMVNFMCQLG